MNNITDEILNSLEQLDYSAKAKIYNRLFSFGYIVEMQNKFNLISLVALTTKKMKEKNPNITALDILKKITGQQTDDSGFYQFLETLAIVSEDMSYACTTFDACGCTSSQEIINKIKEILNTWLPF